MLRSASGVPGFPTIVFFDLQPSLCAAWSKLLATEQIENVRIHCGRFLDLSADAIVSPANSYGFMDGGIDRSYSDFFGWDLQKILQKEIELKHHGELLVGQAEMIATSNASFPYLIAAPTMRVPMVLGPITVNPYLAMRAVLLLWKHGMHNGRRVCEFVQSIAVPGFATGIGRVPPDVCARQQFQAVREMRISPSYPNSWHDAQTKHQLLYTDLTYDLQQD
ncbi:MAG: macro domain-containing protein [Candidatus Uhrbacteria bacterium]|nr:macro domain-containing protein [Candidatus Uhrbacteria bacterium]